MATIQQVTVPDIGGATDVSVIEILVKTGDRVEKEQSLITLEGEKATMEIPSPYSGTIKEIHVKVGDKVEEGSAILKMETTDEAQAPAKETPAAVPQPTATPTATPTSAKKVETTAIHDEEALLYASPAVRRMVREFNLNIKEIRGTGRKDRLTKEDVQAYVKTQLAKAKSGGGMAVTVAPVIDFAKFGEIETKPLLRIKKFTAENVYRSWATIPHVTQFDEADITELEAFRNQQKATFEQQGLKLTPLVFIMKAVVASLKQFPLFNTSLDATGENLVYKKYFHVGIAVDTPNGLVVPVIRDVDKKNIADLAKELAAISNKAREKGLTPQEMSGSCFTISSLGGIGGKFFTPIVKSPDVAILGVSKAAMKPIYQQGQFVPRLMLPLSLSYDHRVVDGAEGARFIVYLTQCLADLRLLLL